MAWGKSITCGLLFAGFLIAASGCKPTDRPPLATAAEGELLMGTPRTDWLATRLLRSDWPAAPNGYYSPQETHYIEYYRDYFGNEFQERQTPQRNFRSYSFGASQRPPRP